MPKHDLYPVIIGFFVCLCVRVFVFVFVFDQTFHSPTLKHDYKSQKHEDKNNKTQHQIAKQNSGITKHNKRQITKP